MPVHAPHDCSLPFMDSFNQSLFLSLNAPEHPAHAVFILAVFFAKYLVLLGPVFLALLWLRRDSNTRKAIVLAAITVALGEAINLLIGWAWPQPRPFALGLGHLLIPHVANASFPSNHLTGWWGIAFALIAFPQTRALGFVFALLGLPLAWSRIYLGIHFPLDMLGAAAVALCTVLICKAAAPLYLESLYQALSTLHQKLFAPLIQRGWVRP